MSDRPNLRVEPIPHRHRGGVITTWGDYATWLEQLVAHVQLRADGHHEAVIGHESEYRALPRSRQRLAQRARVQERRR